MLSNDKIVILSSAPTSIHSMISGLTVPKGWELEAKTQIYYQAAWPPQLAGDGHAHKKVAK